MRLQRFVKKYDVKLKRIAKNNDMSKSLFLVKEIRKIVEKYPDEIKKKTEPLEMCHICIYGMPPELQKQFETIAQNKGLTTSQLLTLHSNDIISSYPDWMIRFEG